MAIKACPSEWHLPSNAEWQTIVDFLSGDKVCAEKGNGNGDNAIGFSALPGGNSLNDNFMSGGGGGYWWSGSEAPVGLAYCWIMDSDRKAAKYDGSDDRRLVSVRCVQD